MEEASSSRTVRRARRATGSLALALIAATASWPQQATAAPAYAGYLFVYFTGEGYSDGEQIHYALSKGNDPLHWTELNGGKPVLSSTVGTKGVRDPFVVRAPQGDRFYLLGTDQRQYGSNDWDTPQRHGSKSIVVWQSTDLVKWTGQHLLKVAPDSAGNAWAPEANYDESTGKYVVYWASKIYAANDPDHTGTTYNRMLSATTADFTSVSTAKTWYDPGHSVIDATVIRNSGTYYRLTKDERDGGTCAKFISEDKSAALLDTSYTHVADCIGKGSITRGEGPLVFKSNTENKWYQFIDEYGGRGYVPFETTDLNSGKWTKANDYTLPSRPRHGTVLPVTQAEYDRLQERYS
ncbi:glycoside hydrolase family 43 protein [Streptomyces sp. NPDC058464]|uniref:glycoside hydrolase family 43 protein n=1 Tax=Streptomyces sp. NPDC058464 TaxID=3346511 RepID=UPI003649A4BD